MDRVLRLQECSERSCKESQFPFPCCRVFVCAVPDQVPWWPCPERMGYGQAQIHQMGCLWGVWCFNICILDYIGYNICESFLLLIFFYLWNQVQHHDGITGTESPKVADMYMDHLMQGMMGVQELLAAMFLLPQNPGIPVDSFNPGEHVLQILWLDSLKNAL